MRGEYGAQEGLEYLMQTQPPPDDYFVSTLVPAIKTAPPPKKSHAGLVLLLIVFGGIGALAFAIIHQGSAKKPAPVTLAPHGPAKPGVPGSLGDVVRIQAEANRHSALQAVQSTNSADAHTLEGAQPNFHWVDGDTPSDGPTVVSVEGDSAATLIAVSASNHDVCAFGRWSHNVAEYVTVEHLPQCAATDAPTAGWSTEPGGAASDIPDDIANS